MFTWIKNLFSFGNPGLATIDEPMPIKEEKPKVSAKTKKSSSGKCNFDSLTKAQLLKEAKHRGVKANASETKAEILKKVKNAG